MVEQVYHPTAIGPAQIAPLPYVPPAVAPVPVPAPIIAPHLNIYDIQQKNIMPSVAAAPIVPIAHKRYDDIAVILVLFILLVIISHCKAVPCKDKC